MNATGNWCAGRNRLVGEARFVAYGFRFRLEHHRVCHLQLPIPGWGSQAWIQNEMSAVGLEPTTYGLTSHCGFGRLPWAVCALDFALTLAD